MKRTHMIPAVLALVFVVYTTTVALPLCESPPAEVSPGCPPSAEDKANAWLLSKIAFINLIVAGGAIWWTERRA